MFHQFRFDEDGPLTNSARNGSDLHLPHLLTTSHLLNRVYSAAYVHKEQGGSLFSFSRLDDQKLTNGTHLRGMLNQIELLLSHSHLNIDSPTE